jgi:hypothetical protein
LGVLIDAGFDLQRAVHQLGFREVVDYRRTVMRPIAAPSNPTNQVVAIGRGERENLDELDVGFARQFHQHKIRLHRQGSLLTRLVHADF